MRCSERSNGEIGLGLAHALAIVIAIEIEIAIEIAIGTEIEKSVVAVAMSGVRTTEAREVAKADRMLAGA